MRVDTFTASCTRTCTASKCLTFSPWVRLHKTWKRLWFTSLYTWCNNPLYEKLVFDCWLKGSDNISIWVGVVKNSFICSCTCWRRGAIEQWVPKRSGRWHQPQMPCFYQKKKLRCHTRPHIILFRHCKDRALLFCWLHGYVMGFKQGRGSTHHAIN